MTALVNVYVCVCVCLHAFKAALAV